MDERSEGDSVPQHDLIGSSNLTLHIRASMMRGDARVMGLRIADLREAVRHHSN